MGSQRWLYLCDPLKNTIFKQGKILIESKDKKYYTGVGSRETPRDILELMTKLARVLSDKNYVVRSGGASGADEAFGKGAGKNVQIFLPWKGFRQYVADGVSVFDNIAEEAFHIARRYHPVFDKLSPAAKSLMARNTHQILGPNLDHSSEFLICWTFDGCYKTSMRSKITGGTGQAIALASDNGIPVFNLRNQQHYEFMKKVTLGEITL